MERKVIAALEWIIRPVTPHVLAYKLLDALPLPFSFPLKRYLVHIVERLCLNYYFSISIQSSSSPFYPVFIDRMNLFDKLETYNMLEIMVAAALEYAFSCTFPTRSKDLSLAVRKLLGSDNHDNALHVNSDLNSKFAYFPITYGKPIQLIYNFSATTN